MKENRSNSRDSRRATLYHRRSLDKPVLERTVPNYLAEDYKLIRKPLTEVPIVSPNPLGVAFGYVFLPALGRFN